MHAEDSVGLFKWAENSLIDDNQLALAAKAARSANLLPIKLAGA